MRTSVMAMEPLTPAPGATEVCPDTPLRLRGRDLTPPRSVSIVGADGDRVAGIETDDHPIPGIGLRTVGGALDDRGQPHLFRYHAVEVDRDDLGGELITVRPDRTLAPDAWYRVIVDGVDRDWVFRTRPSRRTGGRIRVAVDGSADFCTVQGAIDAAAAEPRPVTVEVAAGRYPEICYLGSGTAPLTIRGAGRDRTVISYDNNNRLNGLPSDSRCRFRRLGDRDLFNGWRSNVGVDRPDVSFSDLTMINTTPAGGSQAEALRGNHDRLLLQRVALLGHQDTLRLQGRGFVTAGVISGSVDFVWGTGAGYHWRNVYRSVAPGYVLQVRNGQRERGHVLYECRFTRAAGVPDDSVLLARTDSRVFPHSEVIIIDGVLDGHIRAAGWSAEPPELASTVRFTEHNSVRPGHGPVDLRARPDYVTRPDTAVADRWRDPAEVLDGWVPITANPVTEDTGVADPGETVVGRGDSVRVAWSAPPGHAGSDLVRLGPAEVAVDSAATLGYVELPAPMTPGSYRVSYRPVGGEPVGGGQVVVPA